LNLETLRPETLNPETLNPETLRPETLRPETLKPETLRPETLNPETLNLETLRPETLNPETLNPETLNPETLNPETLNPETLNPETLSPSPLQRWSRWVGSYHPNHPWVFLLEACVGAWFCWKGYELKCLWSFGPGIALLTSPLFHYRGWNSLLVRCLIAIPAVLLLVTMVLTWRTVFGNRLW
jgi:hypothetical protein